MNITYLGPDGLTFSSLAYKKLASKLGLPIKGDPQTELHLAVTNEEVVPLLLEHGGFGCVAVETKAEGKVDSPIDSFIRLLENFDGTACPLQVSGALQLKIKLSLHSYEESLSDVKKVMGHSKALGACKKTIARLGLETLECPSNGVALEMLARAQKGEGLSALGPSHVAQNGGFKILVESLEDCEASTTFYLLTPRIGESRQENAARMFTVFQINDTPGSLMKVLQPLAEQGVNLRMIHSFYFEDGIYRFAIETEMAGGMERLHRATIQTAQKWMARCITFGPFPVYVG